ncbi:glucarate dehydratase family protein [Streptomyces virens]|uniref:glucarate dehydratase n=1 Tax=Streptomyces virens TaxID=285572 RepID=A0ABP6PM48_9ACTN|nr:glucarate dehydratase family protein [Streptomyces calvus]MBA8978435.1 glucarate dehydratase [Streptomyces calvus]MYS28332.1 glucarate dehydratase [Streptomyces sp. SID7804]
MTSPTPRDLTVTEVRLTPILVADPPLLNTQGVHQPYTPRLIIEVVTADGTVGLGETYGDTKYLDLAKPLADRLVGRRVGDLNALFAEADQVAVDDSQVSGQVDVGGLRGVQTADKLRLSVLSGFEVACLDALGKALGLPVHALLGGKVRDAVEYSAYLFYKWARHPEGVAAEQDDWGAAVDPAGIVEQARIFTQRYGFTSFKLKGGVFPPDEEIAAIRALAAAFPGHPLRLDPNGAWSVETSLKVAAELGDVLEYLEDPALGTPAMAEVAARMQEAARSASDKGGGGRRVGVPLATNMCVTTFAEIKEAFTTGAVQVVLSDHHYWGGLRNTQQLAAICRTFGVGVSMHSNTHLGISLAAMTHVAATVPNLHHACDSHYPWQSEDVLTERLTFEDGTVRVSDRPGLGVELDRDRLARLHQRWLDDDGSLRDRDDAAAMRIADPDWVTPTVPRW